MQKNEAMKHDPSDETPETEDTIAGLKPADDGMQKLQDENKSLKDQILRTLADAENMRKRTEKEKDENQKYAVSSFARDLLNVADNLRRSLDAVKPDDAAANAVLKNLLAGVEITEKELLTAMEKQGVKKIAPNIGDAFDYNKHQAMFEVETGEKPPGVIMQILQAGYSIHDRLLRPALVGVSKTPSGDTKVDVKA